MHFPRYIALALPALLGLGDALAHPRHHRHEKRQNWNDPAIYNGHDFSKDVDWNSANIDYTGGNKAAAPQQQAHPQASPAEHETEQTEEKKPDTQPAPAPASKPVVNQKNTEKADTHTSNNNDDSHSSDKGASSGLKRGLAYNNESPNLSIFNSYSKLGWAHNWNGDSAGCPSKYDYVPTLPNLRDEHPKNWAANVKKATAGGGTTYLMSFNEPDMAEPQANLSPDAAASAYREHMSPHASGNVKLGAPSVSNSVVGGQGLNWLRDFMGKCSDCPIDFVPVHWYGCGDGCSVDDDVKLFKKQMGEAMEVAGGRKIWITEFQTHGDSEKFLDQAMGWLDGQSQVERYSYYYVHEGFMVTGGQVNGVGKKFASG